MVSLVLLKYQILILSSLYIFTCHLFSTLKLAHCKGLPHFCHSTSFLVTAIPCIGMVLYDKNYTNVSDTNSIAKNCYAPTLFRSVGQSYSYLDPVTWFRLPGLRLLYSILYLHAFLKLLVIMFHLPAFILIKLSRQW